MSRYVKPNISNGNVSTFTCPNCGVLSTHQALGGRLFPPVVPPVEDQSTWRNGLYIFGCVGCVGHTVFFKDRMIYPTNATGPPAIDGMPKEILTDYEEARNIDT